MASGPKITFPNHPSYDVDLLTMWGGKTRTNQAWWRFWAGLVPQINAGDPIYDLRANRSMYNAADYEPGVPYYESDNPGVVYISNGLNWIYSSGIIAGPLANLPTGLTALDTGLLFQENQVYFHVVQWNGTGWQRGPGDTEHSDTFLGMGAAPSDGGWHVCDGSAVTFFNYANPSSPGTRTLPNTTGTAAYSKFASTYAPAITAAAVPTVAINSFTPAGTISDPTLTMNSYTPAGTVASTPSLTVTPTGSVTAVFIGNASGSTIVLNTGGSTAVVPGPFIPSGTIVAGFSGNLNTVTGTISSSFTGTAAVLTGSISTPTFTGTPVMPTGTLSLTGDTVAHFQLILMYRR